MEDNESDRGDCRDDGKDDDGDCGSIDSEVK